MLSIGEFAIVSGISKKTLRYYDEIGLLKPEKIKKNNQYRLYSKKQVEKAKNICRYKKTGISLKAIKQIIDLFEDNLEKEYMTKRLEEIEIEIKKLEEQKIATKDILQNKIYLSTDLNKLIIRETVLREGEWFVMKFESEIDEIHLKISEFYEEISKRGLELKSKHMVRISEDSKSIIARVKTNQKKCVEKISAKKSAILENVDFSKKDIGYLKLIEYGKNKNCVFDYFIEEYDMNSGKLNVNIQAIYK